MEIVLDVASVMLRLGWWVVARTYTIHCKKVHFGIGGIRAFPFNQVGPSSLLLNVVDV